jgi:hypothetical protein
MDIFVAAITSIKSSDKFIKTNLLTPFGVVIDAFMIADNQGNACVLADRAGQEDSDEFTKYEI